MIALLIVAGVFLGFIFGLMFGASVEDARRRTVDDRLGERVTLYLINSPQERLRRWDVRDEVVQ